MIIIIIITIIIINPLITHFYFQICCTLCWHLGNILVTFWVCKEIRIHIAISVTVKFNNFHKIVINFTWLFLWPLLSWPMVGWPLICWCLMSWPLMTWPLLAWPLLNNGMLQRIVHNTVYFFVSRFNICNVTVILFFIWIITQSHPYQVL